MGAMWTIVVCSGSFVGKSGVDIAFFATAVRTQILLFSTQT